MDDVTSAESEVHDSGSNEAVMAAGCRHMQSAVESLQQYDPIPVDSVQRPFSRSLSMYARAATDCVAALGDGDDALLEQAAQETGDANGVLDDAVSAMRSAAGE